MMYRKEKKQHHVKTGNEEVKLSGMFPKQINEKTANVTEIVYRHVQWENTSSDPFLLRRRVVCHPMDIEAIERCDYLF